MQAKHPTWLEEKALRPFKHEPVPPEVLFAMSGLGNGWGLIDYRFRELFVRIDTEKLCAVGDFALTADFAPCWEIHDVLEAVGGAPAGYIDEEEVGKRIIAEYNKIVSCLSSETGRLKLARMRGTFYRSQVEERMRERGSEMQAKFASRIVQEHRNARTRSRDGAIIGIGLLALGGLWVFWHFFWHP